MVMHGVFLLQNQPHIMPKGQQLCPSIKRAATGAPTGLSIWNARRDSNSNRGFISLTYIDEGRLVLPVTNQTTFCSPDWFFICWFINMDTSMGANTSSWIELRQDGLSYSLNFICSLEVWYSPFRETGVDLVLKKKKSIRQSWESGIKIRKWLWEFSYSLKRLPDDNPSDVIRKVSFPCLFNFVTNWCSGRLPLSTDDFICGSQNPHEIPRPPGVTHLVPVPTTTPLLMTFIPTLLILPHSGLFTSLKGPAATAQTPATSSHPSWSLTSWFSHLRLDLIVNVFLFLLIHWNSSIFPSPLFSCDYVAPWLQQVPSYRLSKLLDFSWVWSPHKIPNQG